MNFADFKEQVFLNGFFWKYNIVVTDAVAEIFQSYKFPKNLEKMCLNLDITINILHEHIK